MKQACSTPSFSYSTMLYQVIVGVVEFFLSSYSLLAIASRYLQQLSNQNSLILLRLSLGWELCKNKSHFVGIVITNSIAFIMIAVISLIMRLWSLICTAKIRSRTLLLVLLILFRDFGQFSSIPIWSLTTELLVSVFSKDMSKSRRILFLSYSLVWMYTSLKNLQSMIRQRMEEKETEKRKES